MRIRVKSTCAVAAMTSLSTKVLAANRTGIVHSQVGAGLYRVELDAQAGDPPATAYLGPAEWEEIPTGEEHTHVLAYRVQVSSPSAEREYLEQGTPCTILEEAHGSTQVRVAGYAFPVWVAQDAVALAPAPGGADDVRVMTLTRDVELAWSRTTLPAGTQVQVKGYHKDAEQVRIARLGSAAFNIHVEAAAVLDPRAYEAVEAFAAANRGEPPVQDVEALAHSILTASPTERAYLTLPNLHALAAEVVRLRGAQ